MKRSIISILLIGILVFGMFLSVSLANTNDTGSDVPPNTPIIFDEDGYAYVELTNDTNLTAAFGFEINVTEDETTIPDVNVTLEEASISTKGVYTLNETTQIVIYAPTDASVELIIIEITTERIQGDIIIGEPVSWTEQIKIRNKGNAFVSCEYEIPLPEDGFNFILADSSNNVKIYFNGSVAILQLLLSLAPEECETITLSYQTEPVHIEIEKKAIPVASLLPLEAFDVRIYQEIGGEEEPKLSAEITVKHVKVWHNSSRHYHNIPVCIEAKEDTKIFELVNGTEKEIKVEISNGIASWVIPELSDRTFMTFNVERKQGDAEIGKPVEWQLNVSGTVIKYRTSAPLKEESELVFVNGTWRKQIIVGSKVSVHYTNVTAFTSLNEIAGSNIKLFLLENDTRIDVTNDPIYKVSFIDTNDNGLIDTVRWNVPSLSNRTFEVEQSINVINVQSYPQVGSLWTVYFDTTGSGVLTIENPNPGEICFVGLYKKVGEDWVEVSATTQNNITEAEWSYGEGKVEYKVLSRGHHTLKFSFGGDIAYAYNEAGSIIINEIMYNPNTTLGGTCNEWIEIYNNGTANVDISGWNLTDIAGNRFIFPLNTTIVGGDYLVIANNKTLFSIHYPHVNISKVIKGRGGAWLDNDGDIIILKNATGIEKYNTTYPDTYRGADGNGKTLEWNGTAWRESTYIGGTPGEANSPALEQNASLNVTITNEKGSSIGANVKIYHIHEERRGLIAEHTSIIGVQKNENYTIEVTTSDGESLYVRDLALTSNISFSPQFVSSANYTGAKPSGIVGMSSIIALNTSSFSFTNATLTLPKNGLDIDRIIHFTGWNFSNGSATGFEPATYSDYGEDATHFWFTVTHFQGFGSVDDPPDFIITSQNITFVTELAKYNITGNTTTWYRKLLKGVDGDKIHTHIVDYDLAFGTGGYENITVIYENSTGAIGAFYLNFTTNESISRYASPDSNKTGVTDLVNITSITCTDELDDLSGNIMILAETVTEPSDVTETGLSPHIKEGSNQTISAKIYNAGDPFIATSNVTYVLFFDGPTYEDMSKHFANISITADISTGGTWNAIAYWNPTLIGTHNISVRVVNGTALDGDLTNNNASKLINVSAWQKLWGNITGKVTLADTAGRSMIDWDWSNETGTGLIYIVNSTKSINWTALHPLGCNADNTLNYTGKDFYEADEALGMIIDSKNATEFPNNNITQLFCPAPDGNESYAPNRTSFIVRGANIPNVPIVNSTNMINHTNVESANFTTGILWMDDGTKNYYDGGQTLVFICNIAHKFGLADKPIHDYEIGIPCALNTTIGGKVDIYVELR